MENKDLIFSILVPAYNHEDYVEDTIVSIWEQNFAYCEIIVVDDGSKDATYKKAKALADISPINMRVVTQKNKGLNKTLNVLARLSKAKYLYFLASDDMLAPGALQYLHEEILLNPKLKAIYGNGKYYTGKGDIRGVLYSGNLLSALKKTKADVLNYLYSNVSNLLTQSSVIERNYLEEIGGFDETALLDDWPHHIKIFKNLKNENEWKFLNINIVHYRRHDNNMSRSIENQFLQITDTVSRFIPTERSDKLLASAYYNLAIIAIAKFNLSIGLKLLILSQKRVFDINRLASVPISLGKLMYTALVARLLK